MCSTGVSKSAILASVIHFWRIDFGATVLKLDLIMCNPTESSDQIDGNKEEPKSPCCFQQSENARKKKKKKTLLEKDHELALVAQKHGAKFSREVLLVVEP